MYLDEKSLLFPSYEYILKNEKGDYFLRMTIERPFLGGNKLDLAFYSDPHSYSMEYSSRRSEMKEGADFIAQFKCNEDIVCTLTNFSKGGWFFSFDASRELKGTIELNDDVHRDKVFGFLLMLQMKFWVDAI